VSVHGCEEREPNSHTRSTTYMCVHTHVYIYMCMHGRGTDIHPRACAAQEPYLQMLPCIDLYIPDAWVASEAHTPDDAHKRARAAAHARTRAYAAAGVSTGDPHIRREIFTSLRSYVPLSPGMSTDSRSLHACSAPLYAHTRTHAPTRAHNGGVDTDLSVHTTWKRSMHVCVGHSISLEVEGARWHSSTRVYR
jgi:hypothetical protein